MQTESSKPDPAAQLRRAVQIWPELFADLDLALLNDTLLAANWPDLERLNRAWQAVRPPDCHVQGFTPQPPAQRYGAAEYETTIFTNGWIPTRPGTAHDLFNAMAWLLWPHSKLALNQAHYREMEKHGRKRTRRRDALTLLDEAGAVVLSEDATLLDLISRHQWRTAWWQRREQWQRQARCQLLGHGLLEQCQRPYIGLTAKALLVHPGALAGQSLDAWLAQQISTGHLHHPHQLAPLPLLGVPGLWADNRQADFYQQSDYFRPASARRPAAGVWT